MSEAEEKQVAFELPCPNYIYLLKEREFVKTKENIYKIGKTKQEHNKRLGQYPKQSVLLFQILCNDCDDLEKKIIKVFNSTYIRRRDIGNEYFEGNFEDMMRTMFSVWNGGLLPKAENVSKTECTASKKLEEKSKKIALKIIKNVEKTAQDLVDEVLKTVEKNVSKITKIAEENNHKKQNKPIYVKYLYENVLKLATCKIKSSDLYLRSTEYAVKKRENSTYTMQEFSKNVKHYIGDYSKHSKYGTVYVFPDAETLLNQFNKSDEMFYNRIYNNTIIENVIPTHVMWILYLLKKGHLMPKKIEALYVNFKKWALTNLDNEIMSLTAFGIMLNNENDMQKIQIGNKMYYKPEFCMGKKQRISGIMRFTWNIQNIITALQKLNLLDTSFVYVDAKENVDDLLSDFIESHCEKTCKTERVRNESPERDTFIMRYNKYLQEIGVTEESSVGTAFTKKMTSHGINNIKSGCKTYFIGIKFKRDDDT